MRFWDAAAREISGEIPIHSGRLPSVGVKTRCPPPEVRNPWQEAPPALREPPPLAVGF